MTLWNSKSSAEKFFSWRFVRIISGDGGDNYLITEEYTKKNEDNSTSSNSKPYVQYENKYPSPKAAKSHSYFKRTLNKIAYLKSVWRVRNNKAK